MEPAPNKKDLVPIWVYVQPEMKEALQAYCEETRKSMSGVLFNLLKNHLAKLKDRAAAKAAST